MDPICNLAREDSFLSLEILENHLEQFSMQINWDYHYLLVFD